VRAYFLTLQYWLGGSEENIANMVRFLVDRYADGPRKVLRGCSRCTAPVDYPEVGVYHPRMPGRTCRPRSCRTPLPAGKPLKGTVGVLLLRSYLLAGNAGHYDGVIPRSKRAACA
jgi:magnesium chelatase subunit H